MTQFDPSIAASDTFLAPQSAGSGALVFWNESSHRLMISFQDGTNLYVPAWFHRSKCGEIGQVKINWDILSTLAANFPPVSEVVVEAYAHGESFPADGPISERSTNIGNAVGLAMSSTSIANDGNVAGTSIVEATVAGDVTSAVSVSNDAQMVLGTAAHRPSLRLKTAINGDITIDQNGLVTIPWQLLCNLIDPLTNNDLTLNAPNTHKIALQNGGTDFLQILANGVVVNNVHILLSNNIALQIKDNTGTAHDVLYVAADNQTKLQMAVGATKVFISDPGGNNLMSIDASGNVRCKGSLTQNVTP